MSRQAAAIDFGTSKIAVVAGRLDERGALRVTGAGMAGYAGFREDEWLDVGSLEDAIVSARKAAEKQCGHRLRDMYVAVPGEYIHVAFNRAEVEIRNRGGTVTRDDIEQLIEASGAYDVPDGYVPLHRIPVAYIIDNQTRYRPPLGEKARFLSGYVSHVMALESFVEDVGATLSNLGIGVHGMVAGPLGTGYMIRTEGDGRRTAVVIDAGDLSTDILVAEGEGLVFHQNIPVGGGTITKDISLILDMPEQEAEILKRQLVLGIRHGETVKQWRLQTHENIVDAQEIAETRVWDISGRVADTLEHLGVVYDGQTGVFLTGGGMGLLRGAKDILSSQVGQIVKYYAHQSPFLGGPAYTAAAGTLNYALNVLQTNAVGDIIGWIRDLF